LLAKFHVSPASTEERLKDLYTEVSTAVDDKLVVDATGRNALYKIHVSLGKIVNALAEKEKSRKSTFGESLRSRDSAAPEGSLRASVARSMRSVSGRSMTPEIEKMGVEESVIEDETTIQQVLPKTRKVGVKNTGSRTPSATSTKKEVVLEEESGVEESATKDNSLVDELLSDDENTIT